MKVLWGLNPVKFFLAACALALAGAFPRYFDHWVYFPFFPNILDSALMGVIGLYLFYDALRRPHRNSSSDS